MSLLNDMLNNLDTRRQQPGPAGKVLTTRQEPDQPKRPPLLLIGFLLAAGLSAGIILNQYHVLDPGQATVSRTTTQPEQADNPPIVISPPARPTREIQSTPVSTSSSNKTEDLSGPHASTSQQSADAAANTALYVAAAASEDQDRAKEIQRLLSEAESALAQTRLTTPANDNAYDRYRRILDLDPEHPAALAGLDRIVAVYLRLARSHFISNDLERTKVLIERAQQVDGDNPEFITLTEQVRVAEESANKQKTTSPSTTGSTVTDTEAAMTNVRQTSSIVKRERKLLDEVESLLQRGEIDEARSRLEQFLVSHPDSVRAIERLFRLYLQMGELDMAGGLLEYSSQLPPSTFIKLGAQLKVQLGNLNEAVRMLERGVRNNEDPGYFALLAGLYQKTGRFRKATTYYRRLLNNDPEQGAYWLGLAVSLDSLGDYREALQAFKRARTYGSYEGDIQRYIEQRIQKLSQ